MSAAFIHLSTAKISQAIKERNSKDRDELDITDLLKFKDVMKREILGFSRIASYATVYGH